MTGDCDRPDDTESPFQRGCRAFESPHRLFSQRTPPSADAVGGCCCLALLADGAIGGCPRLCTFRHRPCQTPKAVVVWAFSIHLMLWMKRTSIAHGLNGNITAHDLEVEGDCWRMQHSTRTRPKCRHLEVVLRTTIVTADLERQLGFRHRCQPALLIDQGQPSVGIHTESTGGTEHACGIFIPLEVKVPDETLCRASGPIKPGVRQSNRQDDEDHHQQYLYVSRHLLDLRHLPVQE